MNKLKSKLIAGIVSISLIMPTISFAVPEPPPGGFDSNGGPGGTPPTGTSSSSNISYTGNTTISEDITENDAKYSSTTGGENALLVSGGTSTITDSEITKSGDSSGDEADFYGTNAAVLVYNDATLNIEGGTVSTDGGHANAVFAYGTGTVNITNTQINTTGNNSGGVMVTGGGTLNANNLTVKTTGNSSASIRSDRGGGTLNVDGGTYQTDGVGSPAIYSTADITVKNAVLTSNASEGVVVEGANSVELSGVELTDTNNTLNGNSETYKNIFLYQSMSGDASVGTASFIARNSDITTNKGDTIFVTNTIATVELENNNITNIDGDFLRIQAGKWGTSGSNGGNVTLKLTNQKANGNIIVDSISTLNLLLENGSVLVGNIDAENQAKTVGLTLSSNSILSLTADTYVDSLENDDESNSNIYSNGQYKLYVNGEAVNINEDIYEENATNVETTVTPSATATPTTTNDTQNNNMMYIIIGVVAAIVVIAIIVFVVIKKGKSKKED